MTIVLDGKAKATFAAILGAVFYAGWMASAAHFNIAGHWQHDKAVAVVVPALKAEATQAIKACERNAGAALQNDADRTELAKCPKPKAPPAVIQSVLATK